LDGHRFVRDACGTARVALLFIAIFIRQRTALPTVVKVRDTLRALGDLAHYAARVGPKVLASLDPMARPPPKKFAAILKSLRG
jgi:hypothetical protein